MGNLPLWIKKHELAEFFRQFGPIESVILIKGHNETGRNKGFGFVIYGGEMAHRSAMKAVEFDGVEFHGRVLTVKLDDGVRLKEREAARERWVEDGEDGVEYRSEWHEEREGSRREFRRVLETQPENWQAVVRAFERIEKVLVLDFVCEKFRCESVALSSILIAVSRDGVQKCFRSTTTVQNRCYELVHTQFLSNRDSITSLYWVCGLNFMNVSGKNRCTCKTYKIHVN